MLALNHKRVKVSREEEDQRPFHARSQAEKRVDMRLKNERIQRIVNRTGKHFIYTKDRLSSRLQ